MVFRIGDRDPATGLYYVIWPDDSSTLNGVKIFNAAHQAGDVVRVTRRSDGMMMLDGVKAIEVPTTDQSISVKELGKPPEGYLNGQIWNTEDVTLPVVTVNFAPGSPTSLAVGGGSFVVRIAIDRPQRRDLSVKCELTGTAPASDYSYVGLDATSKIAIISAGALFKDVTITPIANTPQANETIILKALLLSTYRIGANNIATATITGVVVKPTVTMVFAPGSLTTIPLAGGFATFRISLTSAQPSNFTVLASLVRLLLTANGPLVPTITGITGAITYDSITSNTYNISVVVPAGQTFFDIRVAYPAAISSGTGTPGTTVRATMRGVIRASAANYNIVTGLPGTALLNTTQETGAT
jgi:hypothetical protein